MSNFGAIQTYKLETVSQEHINAKIGEHFGIKVNSNPSTGFSWAAETPNCLVKVASLHETKEREGMVGASYIETLVFKVQDACPPSAVLKLFYKRPWEHASGSSYTIFVNANERM